MTRSQGTLRSIPEDIFHFGVMIWRACAVRQPGLDPPGESAITQRVFFGGQLEELSKRNLPDWLKELMLQCLELDPMKCPTIKEVVVSSQPCLLEVLLAFTESAKRRFPLWGANDKKMPWVAVTKPGHPKKLFLSRTLPD